MNLAWLKSQWNSLILALSADAQLGEAVFIDLVNTYSDSARHYHNLEHIQHILNHIEEVKVLSDRLTAVQLAAWFHDYVYNPQAKDNEIQSAIYAEPILNSLKISLDTIHLVKQIILSTEKHQPLVDSIDNLIFLDADLSILGTSPEKYFTYAKAIRQEYSYLSDREYQAGRKQVIANFFAREKIYYTDYFYQKLESSARTNLQAEIELLI